MTTLFLSLWTCFASWAGLKTADTAALQHSARCLLSTRKDRLAATDPATLRRLEDQEAYFAHEISATLWAARGRGNTKEKPCN